MTFYKADVVKTKPEFGNRVFVIIESSDSKYLCICVNSKKRYNIEKSQIQEKIGEVPIDSPILILDNFDLEEGRDFCLRQIRKNEINSKKWKFLANSKPGDNLILVHRKVIYPQAEFVGINVDRIYAIRARIKGLAHDFRIESLLLEIPKISDTNSGS